MLASRSYTLPIALSATVFSVLFIGQSKGLCQTDNSVAAPSPVAGLVSSEVGETVRDTFAAAQTSGAGAQTSASTSAAAPSAETATIFVQLVEALSAEPIDSSMRKQLENIKTIRRKEGAVELTKQDGSVVVLDNSTEFGARVVSDIADVKDKLASKFGDQVAKLSDDFIGVTAANNHFVVERVGPDEKVVDLTDLPPDVKIPLKRIRLGKIEFNLVNAGGHGILKDIEGIEVVPTTVIIPTIEVKEFTRAKNSDGDDVLTVGVKSLVPRPFRRLFGLKEIMSFSFTMKKKQVQNIGQVPEGAKRDRDAAKSTDEVPAEK